MLCLKRSNLHEDSCKEHISEIKKILKKGKKIYIAGIGSLSEKRIDEKIAYEFPEHGVYYSNGRQLQFHAIANEKGNCYGAYHGKKKPCPRNEFPIK